MLPEIIFDSDTFEELTQEYKNKIAGLYPDWTDYNYHDPGITFLELFAWLRENQQFFMEQLGERHYRHFFRLMGIKPKGRLPARVWAHAQRRCAGDEVEIPKGTVFESGGLPFETDEDERIPRGRICMAESCDADGREVSVLSETQLNDMNTIYISPFGDGTQIGASLRIYMDEPLMIGRNYHLSLQFDTDSMRNEDPEKDFVDLTDIKWQYHTAAGWSRLTVHKDETRNMLYSGRLTFSLDEGEPVPVQPAGAGSEEISCYAIRAVLEAGEFAVAPVCCGISLSNIELVQRRSMSWPDGETIGDGNGFPNQVYALPSDRPLAQSVVIKTDDVLRPGQSWTWEETDNLEGAKPDDSVYAVNEIDGTIEFGNGYYGFAPEGRIAVYEMAQSAGAEGNVKDNAAFTCAIYDTAGDLSFTMARLVRRGQDPETISETLLRAMKEQRKVYRAVTLEDYETLVRQTPGLVIHSCHAWHDESSPKTVNIVVRPGNSLRCSQLSSRYRDNIYRYLEPKKLLGTKIVLHTPQYIMVNATVEVIVSAQYRDAASVLEREVRAWFKEQETVYGQPLEYSDLFGRIDSLTCVNKLNVLSLDTHSVGIRVSSNSNLIPPVNGVFILDKLDIVLNNFRMNR